MLELLLARQHLNQNGFSDPKQKIELIEKAQTLFQGAYLKGRAGLVWGKLTGRDRTMLALETMAARYAVTGRHYAGTRVVPVESIRGSEGRPNDFDRDFNPLQGHTERRWINIAVAWLAGVSLPPVKLIQVDEDYFVVDGHHRISVARALGQSYIDAEVMVWQVRPAVRSEAAWCVCGANC